jgi:hypothetical protein
MALKGDDIDIRDIRLSMEQGGNGDYYIRLFEFDKDMYNKEGELVKLNDSMCLRVSMSGGFAPHDVKMAVFHLWEALEKHGLNTHPLDEK